MSVLSEKQRLKIIFSLQVKSVGDCLTRAVGPYEVTELTYAAEQLFDAIEAAVLPEGWVAVPKEPTLTMLDCLRSDITSNLEKRYQAMIAAAPQSAQAECAKVPEEMRMIPFDTESGESYRCGWNDCRKEMLEAAPQPSKAQASPLDLMECLQDRPVEPSKVVQGKCVTQAKKQEPVAVVDRYTGSLLDRAMIIWTNKQPPAGTKLYARPQDLTAEVERLKKELMLSHMAARAEAHELDHANERIAALEEVAQQARDALQYKLHVVEAIIKLDAVLGNAGNERTAD